MTYQDKIKSLEKVSFDEIRKIANEELRGLDSDQADQLYSELERGVALLETHQQLCYYLRSFGPMHQAKLLDAFGKIPKIAFQNDLDIVDWGCGQAMGTVNFFDYLRGFGLASNVKKVTLIEPSTSALERAKDHVEAYDDFDFELKTIDEFFENLDSSYFKSTEDRSVFHIFSNILDVQQIDLKHLADIVDDSIVSNNYLVCVGPQNAGNHRLDSFFRYFDHELIEEVYSYSTQNYKYSPNYKACTYKAKVYKLKRNQSGHLIPIEYYPTVQFQAAYEFDPIRRRRLEEKYEYNSLLSHFEVAAPFDLGANVYDDVDPFYAVLNTLITRGLPTRTSAYIEERIRTAFDLTERKVKYGEFEYVLKDPTLSLNDLSLFEKYLDLQLEIEDGDMIPLQLALTPVAIARFQKVFLEALITGRLELNKKRWKILVEENDVPFADIAIKDLQNTFEQLLTLTDEFGDRNLPEIDLFVVNASPFNSSVLQEGEVYSSVSSELSSKDYDMVVTQSMLKSVSLEIESFSEFKALNKCYFNIRSIREQRTERTIYTSSLINYKPLVNKDNRREYIEVKKTKDALTYFLQLLFRKEEFRPGQLPILDRALRNLPVIGLLPTGGGKSLTYQIAALLQPGVTMVIDPLKSLMKDQYDGLINSGIDCAAYINSSLSSKEKKLKENQLETSQLLFVFMSPERLSIASFRERLKNMNDYNIYFSYGVIDEVHCVSEWGHDFRFSYLHLGRNLYNYVRAKENEISLFGLTATASFDVLADVERELSGHGAFELDADVIVRYENTNRLELQYKIEKVPVTFEEDRFYDKGKHIDPSLPRALNITNHWPLFDSKAEFLKEYVVQIPALLNELNTDENIENIREEFIERQNNEVGSNLDLKTSISNQYFVPKNKYGEAGIIFCPHRSNTGLSVSKNWNNMKSVGVEDAASFTGKDDDNVSMQNLDKFRDNKSPLMVATKAFGMGIDKPNVRFTVNMNYSSSLEAFVQEAGRAGRDRKMALATILVSDYELVQIDRSFGDATFPLSILKNKWFRKNDLQRIIHHYGLSVPQEYIRHATPANDIVKLHCTKDNKMFGFGKCSEVCSEFKRCDLRKVKHESKGWRSELDVVQDIKAQDLNISRKSFQYLNADYQTMMYFFNSSFKGDVLEKKYMNNLLNKSSVLIENRLKSEEGKITTGFLETVLSSEINENIVIYVPYVEDAEVPEEHKDDGSYNTYSDVAKAIYRMTCIELIEDFTQDYVNKRFRIIANKKEKGGYFYGLKRFLKRYYTDERADIEIDKVKKLPLNVEADELSEEIYRCLAYLTEFVYDKISQKRKRAIDDMRNFCMDGLEESNSWLENNERLKDFIFYYFNSKYAKDDYVADNDEPFSLVKDTEGGKNADDWILFKYLRVIDEDIVGFGTPLDNIKHLYGAVRLISRSLTDSNPSLYLLEVFCLAYMGTKKNKGLEEQLVLRYSEGMTEFSKPERKDKLSMDFWELFNKYNVFIQKYLSAEHYEIIVEETAFLVHAGHFNRIKNKFLEEYE